MALSPCLKSFYFTCKWVPFSISIGQSSGNELPWSFLIWEVSIPHHDSSVFTRWYRTLAWQRHFLLISLVCHLLKAPCLSLGFSLVWAFEIYYIMDEWESLPVHLGSLLSTDVYISFINLGIFCAIISLNILLDSFFHVLKVLQVHGGLLDNVPWVLWSPFLFLFVEIRSCHPGFP